MTTLGDHLTDLGLSLEGYRGELATARSYAKRIPSLKYAIVRLEAAMEAIKSPLTTEQLLEIEKVDE